MELAHGLKGKVEHEIKHYKQIGMKVGWNNTHRSTVINLALGDLTEVIHAPRSITHASEVEKVVVRVRRAARSMAKNHATVTQAKAEQGKVVSPHRLAVERLFAPMPAPVSATVRSEEEQKMRTQYASNGAGSLGEALREAQRAKQPTPDAGRADVAREASTPISAPQDSQDEPEAPKKRLTGRATALNGDERVVATALILRNGRMDGPAFTWNSGWSDERVRDAIRAEIPVKRVAELQKKFVGMLQEEIEAVERAKEPKKPKFMPVLSRVAATEAAIQALREENSALRDRVQVLEDLIAPAPKGSLSV